MKRILFNPLYVLVLAAMFLGGCASQYIRSGKNAYQDLRYQDAIWSLEKGLAKKDNPEARRMLAESYMMVNDAGNANEQYAKVALYTDNTDRDRVLYGQSLMAAGKYSEAQAIFEGILSRDPENKVAASMLQSCKKFNEMRKDSLLMVVEPINIPTTSAVYAGFPYENGMIITSPSVKGDTDPYTNRAFTDLYFTKKEGAMWSTPVELNGVNGPYHDAVAAVSPNGQLLVFTRSFQLKGGKLAGNDSDVSNTQLYQSRKKQDGGWELPELLPFSDQKYMYAHPSFSPDGATMYFSSDMSGSGKMDIFMVRNVDGAWANPQNLGPTVNTAGNEVFPTLRGDNKLYFSSDGHNTLGGLDILSSENQNGTWSAPKHISYPVNTSMDDFSMVWNADGKSAVFTSDRSGIDKLYSFTELFPVITLEGLVLSKDGGKPLTGAKVTLINLTDGTEKIAFTDENGKYIFDLEPGKDYKIKTEKDDFFATTEDISTKGVVADKKIQRVTELGEVYIANNPKGDGGDGGDGGNENDPKNPKSGSGSDSGVYPIPNIYWDYNKADIRPDAIPYLESVIKTFRENQNLRFEIRSHCDSRGSEWYNDDLSAKRAKAVLEYLVKKGVPRSIITSKGYGKSQLLNECDTDVPCSEEKHQENRRTEFIVTKKK